MALEKKQIFGGPLDGLFVKSVKHAIRATLRKDKVVLVALYEWSKDRQGFCYRGTHEQPDLPKTTEALLVNVEPRYYGKMYNPAPYNSAYNVYIWFPREN